MGKVRRRAEYKEERDTRRGRGKTKRERGNSSWEEGGREANKEWSRQL